MMDISVIIPVYNAENTIDICFNSVYNDLGDSGYSFEIIFINDGSVDNSLQCLKRLQDEYGACIIIIDQPNAGPSSARNAGLRLAQGQYIAFCDSDDQWIKGKTIQSMDLLKKYPHIKCLGGKYIGKMKSRETYDIIDRQEKLVDRRLINISLTMHLFKNYFSPQTVTLLKDIIAAEIFFNEKMRYTEDREYFNRIIYKYPAAIVNIAFTRSIMDKNIYGESGLSSNLWQMEKGELYFIYLAYKTLHINFFVCFLAFIYSLMKYIRRILIVLARKIFL